MKSTVTLKLNRDFRRLYAKGKSCVAGSIVIYVMKNRYDNVNNRLGLTVSKTVGNAVLRNRAKRLMREVFRLTYDQQKKGFDIIVVARAKINGKKMQTVMKDFRYAMHKLDMFENEENIT